MTQFEQIAAELALIKDMLGKLVETRERNRERQAKCRARFSPPTVDEVAKYCVENGHDIDPEKFVFYYKAKGWMVGKSKMKDWHAAVHTWVKRDEAANPQPAEPAINKARQELINKGNEEMKRAFEASMGGGR